MVEDVRNDQGMAASARSKPIARSPVTRVVMQILMTLILLAIALYVIGSHGSGADEKHWAYSVIGTLAGLWLGSTHSA